MKIVKSYKQAINILPNTKFPNLGKDMENKLSNWAYGCKGGNGHDVIEKFLSVIDDYEFDPTYSKVLDKNKFELRTIDGKIITIGFTAGDGFESFPSVSVTEDNIERKYDVDTYGGKLYVDLQYHEEKDTGFFQFYYYTGDHFYKKDGNKRVSFDIKNPNYVYQTQKEDEILLIADYVKEEFKKTEFPTILDAFHFITDRVRGLTDFNIRFYELETWNTTDEITVRGGLISGLKLEKEVHGSHIIIEESFANPKVVLIDVPAELEEFKNRHEEIQRKLNQ